MRNSLKKILPAKLKNIIKHQINTYESKIIEADLLIFDDIFPNPISDWRQNEFLHYLREIKNTFVVKDILNFHISHSRQKQIEVFAVNYPLFQNRIITFKSYDRFKAKLGYCLFYNNLRKIYPILEKNNIPFVFTLYPGGGFALYDNETESNLKTYFKSPLFRHVIVNMPYIYDYLLERFELKKEDVTLIYGAPLKLPTHKEKRILGRSNHLKIVFSAHKYMPYGIDKGFDIFNRVAKQLEGDKRFKFYCIGGFTENDLMTQTNNIQFIETKDPEGLGNEFLKYDIIISPNRSHIQYFGSFDGFPTGSVVHACNSGCLMMLTDDWGNAEKIGLVDNEHFILISPNARDIVDKLLSIIKDDKVNDIARKGKEVLTEKFNIDKQLLTRTLIINKYLQ